MERNSIDDMFSQMLGELDDLTQQLSTVSVASAPQSSQQAVEVATTVPVLQQSEDVTDFDEEDVNLTAILNDLSQIQQNIKESQDDEFLEERVSEFEEQHEVITEKVLPPDDVAPPTQPVVPAPKEEYSHLEPMEEKVMPQVEHKEKAFVPAPKEEYSQPEPMKEKVILQVEHKEKAFVPAPKEEYSQPEPMKEKVIPQVEYKEEEVTDTTSNLSQEDLDEQAKSEKVRIAMEKLKEARIVKLVVKVYTKDDSAKTLMIDERMSTREVLQQLIDKNHFDFSPQWSLIEEMPSMFLERMLEEHEKPCEILKHWTRDSTNLLRFVERKDKYAMFKNPQHFLLSTSELQDQMQEQQKRILIEEFFSEKGPSSCTPEVEGFLYIKNGKSWPKKYCVLRSSGLYFSKTGEPKKGKKLTDLTCLVLFEQNYLYVGHGWKKKFKSPFEYGFALKHPALQVKTKYMRYLACEDFKSLMRWTVGIRLAKHGRQLLESYEMTNEEMRAHSTVPITYQTDAKSIQSSDDGGTALRSATLPRNVDVKNIFQSAWQRASQPENIEKSSPDFQISSLQRSTIPRAKSTSRSSQKKGTNWWDMRDSGQGSSQSNFDESSLASADDLQLNVTAEAGVPSSDSDFDLPPPPEDFPPPPSFEDLQLAHGEPPPPLHEDLRLAQGMPPPPSHEDLRLVQGKPAPPPLSTKPKLKSSHDRPPIPAKPIERPASDNGTGFKIPPPVRPKSGGSNSSLPGSSNNASDHQTSMPPLPPPPPNGSVAPLSNYYMGGDSDGNYAVDDFPPPPPFILDLKESFDAVTEPSLERRKSVDQTPRPSKLIAYIKSQTLSRLQGNRTKAKKVPPAPPRTAATRRSSKRR